MQILNIAGYQFTPIESTSSVQTTMREHAGKHDLKGTILVSPEGVNISLAGSPENISAFQAFLKTDPRWANIKFHETYSNNVPFKHLKVKLKKEIITYGQPNIDPSEKRAPHMPPAELKQWLDEGRDFTLLDTRNAYEVKFGTFDQAEHFDIKDFGEFPEHIEEVDKEKPVVMFCTGGIRCEKAAIDMKNRGYDKVYQLDGGILGYFKEVGGAHWHGDCFIFDGRTVVDPELNPSDQLQCQFCQNPIVGEPVAVDTRISCHQCH